MQVKLEHGGAGFIEQLFKIINVLIALADYFVRHPMMNALDEHVFIMRTVKDAYHSLLRHLLMNAPEKIVFHFGRGWLFKRHYAAAHRVNSFKNIFNGAVLA